MGVDLFFAISGLLITSQLMEGGDLRSFYIRRAFRILPPAILYLGVVFALGLVARGDVFACLAIHRNYVRGSNFSVHFWSLSLEEQFYLVWPFVLQRSGKRAPTAAFIGIAAVCIWRALAAPHLTGWFIRTEERCDGLLWGCLAAFWLRERAFRPGKIASALCLAGAVAVWQVPLLMSLMPALLAVGVLGSVQEPTWWLSRLLESKPLVWVGQRSYGIYLWQMLFLLAPLNVPLALRLVLSVSLPALPYRFFEMPLRRVGRRIAAAVESVSAREPAACLNPGQ